jgi:CRP-like cAMP-binding protein
MWAKRFDKGDLVVIKDSPSDALMFLVTGNLQVVDYTQDGKEIGLNLLHTGCYFGELALIDGLPRSASIIAIETAVVAYLPKKEALGLIYGKPAISERMLKHFAQSIRSLTAYRALLAIPNTHQRLFAMLCQIKVPTGAGQDVIRSLPTQRQIAIMINTSRETVSRALAELQQRGVLKKVDKRFIVIRPHELERLAGIEDIAISG